MLMDLHCILIHELLRKVVRCAFDAAFDASVAVRLPRLIEAFCLVPFTLSACLSH